MSDIAHSADERRRWQVFDWGPARDDGTCQWLSILNKGDVFTGDAWMIARVGNENWGDREYFNALLIAAAPCLLLALGELANAADEFEMASERERNNNRILKAIEEARAAIAKATGQ